MFSETIDSCVQRSGRPDKVFDIIDFANATIREMQALALFWKDMIEYQITITANPMVWMPLPLGFRVMRTVLYPDGTYPSFKQPGRILVDQVSYYYGAAGYFTFVGAGDPTQQSPLINIAYYQFVPRLRYYIGQSTYSDGQSFSTTLSVYQKLGFSLAPGTSIPQKRPAFYDPYLQTFSYFDLSMYPPLLNYTLPANQPIAQALVTNWLLTDHWETVKEGTLAKLYKSVKDETRSIQSYSLYKSMQDDFKKTEGYETLIK